MLRGKKLKQKEITCISDLFSVRAEKVTDKVVETGFQLLFFALT